MFTKISKGEEASAWSGVVVATLMASVLVACAPLQTAEPEEVSSENPSVTYNYSTDQELLAARQKAANYCRRYQTTIPQSGTVTSNQDGTNSVTFECVPVATTEPAVAMSPSTPPMTYTYRTPQELLQVSQTAEATCRSYGKESTATISANGDGSKTATFQCVP